MLTYKTKLIILIIAIAILAGGVGFLAYQYLIGPRPEKEPVNLNEPAIIPTPSPQDPEAILNEMKSKFGTLEYCDYFRSFSIDQYNECVMALVTMTLDKQFCVNITDEKLKGECEAN